MQKSHKWADTLLKSETDIDEKISILDEWTVEVKTDVELAVQALARTSQHRLFIAERLYKLGSVIIEPLHNLYESSDDADLQFDIAFLLLKLGDLRYIERIKGSVPNLGGDYICLVANALAQANVIDAVPLLLQKLSTTESLHEMFCIINSLNRLIEEIPEDTRSDIGLRINERLSAVAPDDFSTIATALQILQAIGYPLTPAIRTTLAQYEANHVLLELFD